MLVVKCAETESYIILGGIYNMVITRLSYSQNLVEHWKMDIIILTSQITEQTFVREDICPRLHTGKI